MALHLFTATSLGMFLATFARKMPQFALGHSLPPSETKSL
jgi:hypothetical protein